MITRFAVRKNNHDKFVRVISLRKQGHSYGEIMKLVPVAKSTINCWITFAGLNLSQEHLHIQTVKRMENHTVGSIASRITRKIRKDVEIQQTIDIHKKYFKDPFYNYALALFEAEGCKATCCRFSNSDFRLVETFIKFIERYFLLNRQKNMTFRLYIHETRKNDLEKIINFWSKKIGILKEEIKVSWKRNIVTKKRENPEYVGQMDVRIIGEKILGSKLLAISDIILRKYQKVV